MSQGDGSSDSLLFSYNEFEAWYSEQRKRFLEPALQAVTRALDEWLGSELAERERQRVRVGHGRVKSAARTWRKLTLPKYADRVTSLDSIPDAIDDLVATRIICTNTSDLTRIWDLIKRIEPWEKGEHPVLAVEHGSDRDYTGSPKESGYRACHINVKTAVNAGLSREMVTCEIQLRTLLQDSWGELTHEDTYKPGSSVSELVTTLSRRMADLLATLDDMAEDLRDELDRLSEVSVQSEPEVITGRAPERITGDVVAAQSYLRQRIAGLDGPTDLASLAWEMQREFGQSISDGWLGFGTFKELLKQSDPAVVISPTPPSFVIPNGFDFEGQQARAGLLHSDVPGVAIVLKGIDRSFPYHRSTDWPGYFEYLSSALAQPGCPPAFSDVRMVNYVTKVARDLAASDAKQLARNGFNYVALALFFTGRLKPLLSAEEIGEAFADNSLRRARDAVSVSTEQETEFRKWLGLESSMAA